MKKFIMISMIALVGSFSWMTYAGDSTFLEIPVLNETRYLSFGSQLHEMLTDDDQRSAALKLIGRFHSGLQYFSMDIIALQVLKWGEIRSSLQIKSVEDLLVSNMIGALICGAVSYPLSKDLEMTASYYQRFQTSGITPFNVRSVESLRRSCAENFAITASLRSHFLTLINAADPAEIVFAEVIEEAERRSRERYIEKWGDNPLIMLDIEEEESLKGFEALCDHVALTWEEIVDDLTGFAAKAYFVAVDWYITQCFFETYTLLNQQDLPEEQYVERYYDMLRNDIWYDRFSGESKGLGYLNSPVIDVLSFFESRHKLLLLENE